MSNLAINWPDAFVNVAAIVALLLFFVIGSSGDSISDIIAAWRRKK